MLFRDFSLHLQKIEAVSSRLEMMSLLADLYADLLQKGNEQELILATYLMQGSLVPSYQSLEFQMSEKMLLRTLARVLQKHNQGEVIASQNLFAEVDQNYSDENNELVLLQKDYKKIGDIGQLFENKLLVLSSVAALTTLSIEDTHQLLENIAFASGPGSQEQKVSLLADLIIRLDPLSTKYLSRIILSKMRLGFSTMTILDALSFVKNQNKADSADLEKAFFKKADLGKLALAYLVTHRQSSMAELLATYQAELGVPILPVLCQRLNSAAEIIDKMGEVIAEPKYDGLRVQIHFKRDKFVDNGLTYKAFTRNLDDVTHMFPELASLAEQLNCQNCILDSEAVGIDRQTGGFLPFQTTIQRKRKHDISNMVMQVPICFFTFDLLWLDGQALLSESLTERKKKLSTVVKPSESLAVAKFSLIAKADELKKFHEEQLALGLEGAVMKQPTSEYVAGRKSWRWVKIKEEEGSQGKLTDTLDCVMMGYYVGKGKRNAFGIGALLVGVVDRDSDGNVLVKSLSKIGTGFTDEQFRQIKLLADQAVEPDSKKPMLYEVHKNLFPDVWLKPEIILEIAADEISKSPIHTAGVALRFPRLVKIRSDKNLENATTLEELAAIHIAT